MDWFHCEDSLQLCSARKFSLVDWTQLGGKTSEMAHLRIYLQNKEEIHMRISQEKDKGIYDRLGRCIMKMINCEIGQES